MIQFIYLLLIKIDIKKVKHKVTLKLFFNLPTITFPRNPNSKIDRSQPPDYFQAVYFSLLSSSQLVVLIKSIW